MDNRLLAFLNNYIGLQNVEAIAIGGSISAETTDNKSNIDIKIIN